VCRDRGWLQQGAPRPSPRPPPLQTIASQPRHQHTRSLMNFEPSQDGSQRGQLLFRRTSAACNMLSDKLSHVRINSEGSSSQLCAAAGSGGSGSAAASAGPAAAAAGAAAPMSQDGLPPLPTHNGVARQASQQLLLARGLTIDTTRYPSQSDMAW